LYPVQVFFLFSALLVRFTSFQTSNVFLGCLGEVGQSLILLVLGCLFITLIGCFL
jgi:hypothetical protein